MATDTTKDPEVKTAVTPQVVTPQVEKAPKPTVPLDWKLVTDKFNTIETYLKTLIGQAGKNPFIWAENTLRPLKDRYLKGNESLTPELYAEIMKLPSNPSCDTAGITFEPGRSSVNLGV